MNRFKGLDLVDTVPEELRMDIYNTIHEAVTKSITKKKICKRTKWLSEEALQITEREKSERQGRKGKIFPSDCRVPKNSNKR